ncbi:MAG: polysaccharide export outer membrane protein [Glaciecola sp.]|jgi:polysaccharide export outer membrane protein
MNKLVLFFCFAAVVTFSHAQSGVSPSSITKQDLLKYGINEKDMSGVDIKYGQSVTNTPSNIEIKETDVIEDNIVVPVMKGEPEEKVVYGKKLFNNKNLSIYKSATHIKAADDYILGSGDEISVSIWGYSEYSGLYGIAEDGSISPKLVGKIYLKGLTYLYAKKMIVSRFGKIYDLENSQIGVELNYSKVIRVNIVGEVNNPGTYTVPAINPVFNILSLAGGITQKGTVRNIEIKRGGETVNVLDVYKYLKDPTYKNDFFLLNDDYILVNYTNGIIVLDGEVRNPGLFELNADESLNDLIELAGGFLPEAYRKRISIKRFQNDRDELLSVNYDSLFVHKKKFLMKDGDRVYVQNVPMETRNMVTIKGDVNIDGHFVFTKGMTVKDLISQAQGAKKEAELEKALLVRYNSDFSKSISDLNLKDELSGKSVTSLKEFDELTVYSKTDYLDSTYLEIIGSVRSPKKVSFRQGMTLEDLIFIGGGLLPVAVPFNIEIARVSNFAKDGSDAKMEIINIEVEDTLFSEQNRNIVLKPNDIVFVRSISKYKLQQIAYIQGEVRYGGGYAIEVGEETVRSLLTRAGGLTTKAFLEGAYIERKDENGINQNLIFNLETLLEDNNEEYNYVLKERDLLVIPAISNYVTVSGAIDYEAVKGSGDLIVPFKKGRRAKYFINEYAAGFHDKADRSKTYAVTPGGLIKRTKNFLFWKRYPKIENGDQIYVLEKKVKEKKKDSNKVDWNRAIENTTVKITGLATLYIIITNLSN